MGRVLLDTSAELGLAPLALLPPPQFPASGHQISPPSKARKSAYWRTLPSDVPLELRCSALEPLCARTG